MWAEGCLISEMNENHFWQCGKEEMLEKTAAEREFPMERDARGKVLSEQSAELRSCSEAER